MNLLRTTLRRTFAVIAGSIVGLAGVAVFAAPASAHAPVVSGKAGCVNENTDWTVDWTIGNDNELPATVSSIAVYSFANDRVGDKLSDSIVGVNTGDPVAPESDQDPSKAIKGSSRMDGRKGYHQVQIQVVLKWEDGFINDGKDGHPGPQIATVSAPAFCEHTLPPLPTDTPSATPSTSAPSESTPELPVPTPPQSNPSGEPKPIVNIDCTTMTLGFDNPDNGVPLKLDYATSKGEKRSITIAPGEKKSEKFSATEGFAIKLTISVTVAGKTYSDFANIDYHQPADCDNGGQAGGLPVTGAAAGGIAGGAAVLLVAGGALFVMARRRKVKFTA